MIGVKHEIERIARVQIGEEKREKVRMREKKKW